MKAFSRYSTLANHDLGDLNVKISMLEVIASAFLAIVIATMASETVSRWSKAFQTVYKALEVKHHGVPYSSLATETHSARNTHR